MNIYYNLIIVLCTCFCNVSPSSGPKVMGTSLTVQINDRNISQVDFYLYLVFLSSYI